MNYAHDYDCAQICEQFAESKCMVLLDGLPGVNKYIACETNHNLATASCSNVHPLYYLGPHFNLTLHVSRSDDYLWIHEFHDTSYSVIVFDGILTCDIGICHSKRCSDGSDGIVPDIGDTLQHDPIAAWSELSDRNISAMQGSDTLPLMSSD